MKRALVATGAMFFLFFIGTSVTPRSESQTVSKSSGWIDIMPDSSLDHWTRLAFPANHPLKKYSQWSVDSKTHTLVCAGDGGHEWLRYDAREPGNFLFHVEWRLIERAGAKGYNSGVFVRNSSDGAIWYQAQVGSSSGGYWFGYDNPAVKGLISFNLHSEMTTNPVKPAGEWNTFDIRGQGAKLILKVNGVKTSEFNECRNLKGYIGLEAEGFRIEFRQLRIKLLK